MDYFGHNPIKTSFIFSGKSDQAIRVCLFAIDKFIAVLNSGFVLNKVNMQLSMVLYTRFIKDPKFQQSLDNLN